MSKSCSIPFVSRQKGALIDTNLLTVIVVGALGVGEIEKFKRTNEYTTDDFAGLDSLLASFGWLAATPSVIAETCNIIDWLNGKKKQAALSCLATYVQRLEEHSIESKTLVETPIYFKLGITDAALFHFSRNENLVLVTADLPLYGYASGMGVECINFNHIRDNWL
jgi:hypothetical protein